MKALNIYLFVTLSLLGFTQRASAQHTYLLRDINQTVVVDSDSAHGESADVRDLIEYKDRVYFLATSTIAGGFAKPALLSTDGTASGTIEIMRFSDGDQLSGLTRSATLLHFRRTSAPSATIESWVSDGTAAGTRLATSQGQIALAESFISTRAAGDRILYLSPSAPGYQLWSVDPATGWIATPLWGYSMLLAKLAPGLTPASVLVAYSLSEQRTPLTLSFADGTKRGNTTLPVTAVEYAFDALQLSDRIILSGVVSGAYSIVSIPHNGNSITLLARLTRGEIAYLHYLSPGKILALSEQNVRAIDLNATLPQNTPIFSLPATESVNSQVLKLVSASSEAYFTSSTQAGADSLWRTDGTSAGTRRILTSGKAPLLETAGVFGGELYFAGFDETHGFELWRSNGTSAGTVQLEDIALGGANSTPGPFALAGSTFIFAATNFQVGRELWALDLCPLDPIKVVPGICGCGTGDSDANDNGIADCMDPITTPTPTSTPTPTATPSPQPTAFVTSLQAPRLRRSGRDLVVIMPKLGVVVYTVTYKLRSTKGYSITRVRRSHSWRLRLHNLRRGIWEISFAANAPAAQWTSATRSVRMH